jgi:hypothetical protein
MTVSPAAKAALKEAMEESVFEQHCADYDGLCLACGEWSMGGCEPDARRYLCECCDERAVYGAEECLFMIVG